MNKQIFKSTLVAFLYLILHACTPMAEQPDKNLINRFSELHSKRDYFRIKDLYGKYKSLLGNEYSQFYGALLDSYFNQTSQSNNEIENIAKSPDNHLSDSLMSVLYSAKVSNHVRLYEYAKAAETCKLLIDKYSSYIDSTDFQDLKNGYIFWKALAHIPKLDLQLNGSSEIPLQIDNRGFWNVDIELSDTICPFMFDTGAGTSLIKRSVALRCGYKIIQLDYPIKAFTGKDIKTNLAIAEKMKMGEHIFDHVIFLVVDDDKLNIPNKNIPVGGILGFSAIAAMGEILISNGKLSIPDSSPTNTPVNMAINHLSPIVATGYKTDTLLLKFDTGALKTNFQPLFYRKYQQEIETNYTKKTIHAGSFGGYVDFDVFKTKNLELSIGKAQAKVNNTNVFTSEIKHSNKNYHGNLGLDFMKQFKEIRISFKNSTISFN